MVTKGTAGARKTAIYHGNTPEIVNAIQREMLGSEKMRIFTLG
jgi:hypothetical protein